MWRQVLEGAKEKFRVFLTTDNGFPSREVGLQEARDCLMEALEDFRKLGKKVEKGTYAIIYPHLLLLISNSGCYKEYKDDMAVLVSDVLNSFHLKYSQIFLDLCRRIKFSVRTQKGCACHCSCAI
jgi:hypothetical protein